MSDKLNITLKNSVINVIYFYSSFIGTDNWMVECSGIRLHYDYYYHPRIL